MSATRTVSVIVKGRVQGVSYRAWTQAEARARGLSGYVRNRDDGSVEALFSGPPEAVDHMVALCRSGPPAARVTDVTLREGGEAPETGRFEILRG
ncbi:acylphosphatase [Methylobacterium brachiatum]|jgi:acylphosphatase|uniref:acylphosphatase n=1 Tax=Methylobacterium brachiatum TaxID=269660 RepID=A0AAJ1TS95_9HYPH|nr:acylphosphatase [Methylobacterium brachiatum]MCB4800621.1 acylphosphatase [Methylobacterium brachiatum]MDF2597757.1 acylphosphatase [Methylobacterium brachiatum]MDQ0541623.1 acylphosphatase [Methylobacterium brachiatum]